MRKYLLFLFLVTAVIYSCKKKPVEVKPLASTWTIDTKNYTAETTRWTGLWEGIGVPGLKATESSSKAYVVVGFKAKPTASGQYTIFIGDAAKDMKANQVAFEFYNGSYWYHGQPGGTVNVTVTNNKLKIDFTNVRSLGGGPPNSITSSGTLVEQ